MFEVWTDGACEPNPGKGGWGYTRVSECGEVVEDCGGEHDTTNNRMELTAILMALEALPTAAMAVIYSDSEYAVKGLTVCGKKWAKRNWRRKDGKPMPNRDLWVALDRQAKRVNVTFKWVRGHNGNEGNDRADELAGIGRWKAMQ